MNFDLDHSRLALRIQMMFALLVALLFGIQLPWYLTMISLIILVFSGWHFRLKKRISQLSILDKKQWSLGFDNGQVHRGELVRVVRLPWLLLIYFEPIMSESDQSSIDPLSIKNPQHYFIWKDQCDEAAWRYFRQLGI